MKKAAILFAYILFAFLSFFMAAPLAANALDSDNLPVGGGVAIQVVLFITPMVIILAGIMRTIRRPKLETIEDLKRELRKLGKGK